MLAARASAARSASRIARNARRFATVIDSAGVKVAAADNGEPTTAVTFLVKAGSRYEATTPGGAHVLQNFAYKVRLDLVLERFERYGMRADTYFC